MKTNKTVQYQIGVSLKFESKYCIRYETIWLVKDFITGHYKLGYYPHEFKTVSEAKQAVSEAKQVLKRHKKWIEKVYKDCKFFIKETTHVETIKPL